ncbi:MAG: hypothetical protein ACRED2_05780, partial [Methylocella sp.]
AATHIRERRLRHSCRPRDDPCLLSVGGQSKTALCRELMRKTDVSVERSYSFVRALGAEHPATITILENLWQAQGKNQRDSDLQLLSSEHGTSLSEILRLLD